MLLENGFASFMNNKELPSNVLNPLSQAEARGKAAKKGMFGSALPMIEFDAGSFKKPVVKQIVGLDCNSDFITFRFAENKPVLHESGVELVNGKVGQFCLVRKGT